MTFTIEHGDNIFLIVAPDGQLSRPVHYCFWATFEHEGRIYGAFLTGEVDDNDEPIDGNGEPAKVYDITDFPNMVPMDTILSEVEYDGEVTEKGISKDGLREVECSKCDGDGFYYEKVPGWVPPPPEYDDEPEPTG